MPAEIDHVVDDLGAANQRIWQAVMQVSQYLAQHQQAALREAEISGTAHAKALRSTIEGERIASERIYNQALQPKFWNDATSKEAAHVYGLATRFSTVDPQAAMAARTCEREAAERWNIDLDAPAPAQPAPMAEVRDVMPEVPGEFRDWYATRAEAARSAARAIREAKAVLRSGQQAMTNAEIADALEQLANIRDNNASDMWEGATDNDHGLLAGQLADEAKRLRTAAGEIRERVPQQDRTSDESRQATTERQSWDSLEAREKWENALRERGYSPEAVKAITTAEKGFPKPPADLLRESKPTETKAAKRVTTPARVRAWKLGR